MSQKPATWLLYRLFSIILVMSLLSSNLDLSNVLIAQAQHVTEDVKFSSLTRLPQDICMIDGTVQISLQGIDAIKSALAIAIGEVDFHGAECFAPIDLRDEGDWYILTLIGVIGVQSGSEWTASSNGVWSDLALIHFSFSSVTAAIAGTRNFSELLEQVPETILSKAAKNALDPLVSYSPSASPNEATTALASYIFPFESGTLVKFFRFHWDTTENYTFWTGANSKAVDLGSDGNTGANHAPNRLLAVASGWVKHRCSEEGSYSSTYIAVENDDGAKVIYAHINKSDAPAVGTHISQGQYLGALKIGDFIDGKCGHASQGSSEFHVHFEVPDTPSFTLSDWTLNTSTGMWTRGSETWSAGEYKQIGAISDEFNNPTLDPRWHWYREDPTHWSLTASPGYLRIITQPKDIWRGNNNAPLLLQSLQQFSSDDFEIQTRIVMTPIADHHQGGLVVYDNDDNYVRFTYAYIDGPKFEFAKEIGGDFQPIQVPAPVGINDFHLRLVKLGTNYFAYYSHDNVTWTLIGTQQNVNISPREVGLLAFNAMDVTSIEIPADFDYFHIVPRFTIRGADTTGVFRPRNGLLYLKNQNTTGFADIAINYGIPGDYPVVGDWDGDGTVTIGIYRNGSFYLRNSNTIGFADGVFAFGTPGDQPIAGDWDGDGIDTIGVYRPWTGQFLLRNSNTAGAAEISFYLGNVGDVGIAGDWDGDGMDTTGVFRPSNGIIFLKNTNVTGFADIALNYGIPGDRPVTGDWNNDGIDTIGVYRNGIFYLRNSNTVGFADIVFGLGIPGDMPIAGDWDGLP